MKCWTVQKRSVLEQINKEKVYQPDFSKSDLVAKDPDLYELYKIILDSYNYHNETNLPGLIFTFMKVEGQGIYEIDTYEDFKNFIREKKPCLNSLWKNLLAEDTVVIEIEKEDDFNPIFIDLNDFQFLMPPMMILPPYTEESIRQLLSDINAGVARPSIFPSGVMQAHLADIQIEDINGIYPMFDFEE